MTRYAWCTDVHLDFLNSQPQRIIDFINGIKASNVDGLFLTGDISTAELLSGHLGMIEAGLNIPINFVLGNHDYYGSSLGEVRDNMKELSNESVHLRYLPTLPYVALSPTTAVVGHDGWYDGLYGDWKNSSFIMSDWSYIKDYASNGGGTSRINLRQHDLREIVALSQKFAMQGVHHVHDGIKAAVRYHKNIIILTHFPPFEEAHIHQGRIGDAHAQPWYTSKMMGDMLKQASRAFPQTKFTILAGHTHGQFDGQIADNMTCHVGGAEYGVPSIQNIIDII